MNQLFKPELNSIKFSEQKSRGHQWASKSYRTQPIDLESLGFKSNTARTNGFIGG